MRQRSPVAVLLLSIITFGIYGLVVFVKTKNDMNKLGAEIPTAWLLVVPLVGIYWLWKYSVGVEKVTNGKISAILSFVLLFLIGTIGQVILQIEFNKIGDNAQPVADGLATPSPAPVAPNGITPDTSFGAPVAPATPVVSVSPDVSAAPVAETPPAASPEAVSPVVVGQEIAAAPAAPTVITPSAPVTPTPEAPTPAPAAVPSEPTEQPPASV
ncbi:MAG: hypothetical protein JWN38_993 [Candidatus Saccharibacteria bacterium]|nr:hypothetical protein [Candidatus Saccharibacteria bacterium]